MFAEWDDLIEATIDSIRIEFAKKIIRIDVTCMWQEKHRRRITAFGVDDFVINEMRLENVIDRVTRFGTDIVLDGSSSAQAKLFTLLRGREPVSQHELQWPILLEKLAHIQNGTLCLMQIEPVCGAAMIVLAESFKLEMVSGEDSGVCERE